MSTPDAEAAGPEVPHEPIQVLLNRVKSEVGAVSKDGENLAQRYKFRGVDAVVNALSPYLAKYGVITRPEVTQFTCEQVEIGQKKTPMTHVTLLVTYHFTGPRGDSVQSTVFAHSLDTGDKAGAKAMSVAYRTALLQTFALPTDDKDPDEYSYGDYEQNGGFAGNAKTANSANSAKTAQAPVKPDWVSIVENTDNVETLRSHFKEAGRLGQLQDSLALSTGERMTLEQALIARGDALNLKSGANGAGARS